MQILLIEPYMGGSHRAWAEGYSAASAHEVTLVTLEARWWTWRMKGSAVTLAEKVAHLAEGGYRPDVILVSDMVDVAALRTFLHPSIGRPPLALYFHESQFTYPDSPQMTTDSSYPFLNWTSAVAADAVFFNSPYHRDVFFSELPRLFKSFPDYTHTHLVDSVAAKTSVLPVGVDLSWTTNRVPRDGPPLVLWNHRWEYDKDPETFADAIRAVAATHDFRLALAGERFRTVPGALDELADDLPDRIEANDHLPTRGLSVTASPNRRRRQHRTPGVLRNKRGRGDRRRCPPRPSQPALLSVVDPAGPSWGRAVRIRRVHRRSATGGRGSDPR
jgi:glycosyltransferase involved in cell wall biosynthesis